MCKQHGNGNEQSVMEWHYRTISEKFYHIDLGHFHTYGIQLIGPNYEEIIHDVSVSEKTVIRMTELFNRCQLLPSHFQDAVEDLLP